MVGTVVESAAAAVLPDVTGAALVVRKLLKYCCEDHVYAPCVSTVWDQDKAGL